VLIAGEFPQIRRMASLVIRSFDPAATAQNIGRQAILTVCSEATGKRNDPPVSLPRRLRVEPVDQFFSC
jgi:hypothetical protein